ncbi:caspase family protein [Bacteroidota bacterium]
MKKLYLVSFLICISLASFSQKSNINKAKNLLIAEKYEDAREYIDQAVINPKTSESNEAWFVRGEIYYKLSESSNNPITIINTSFDSYKKAKKYGYKTSDIQFSYLKLNNLCYTKAAKYYTNKDYEKSMNLFYLGYNISKETNSIDLDALYNAALSADQMKYYQKSSAYYKILYDQDYKSENFFSFGSIALIEEGDINFALKILKKGREEYPDSKDLIIREINIYLVKNENEKALILMKKALELDPANPQLYFAFGSTLDALGNRRYEAENAYKKAIEIDPNYIDAYYNLGALYLNTGIEIQNRANDFPLDKVKEYEELKSQADKSFKIAIPYLESAYTLNPQDQVVITSLKGLYKRFKINDKLDAINNNTLVALLTNQTINNPPEIIITAPSNSRGFKILDPYTTTKSSITIAGQAIDDNGIKHITINGHSVSFDNDGYFSKSIGLTDGFNSFHIKAFDLLNNESQIELYFEKEVKTKAVATLQAEEKSISIGSDYYALIIGVNDYEDPSVPDLDNPINDAQKFYTVITTYYTFSPGNITFIKNPNRDELYDAFEDLNSQIDENDNLLIFYAGHGHWDKTIDRGYWLPSDAKADKKSSWFSNTDLTDFIKSYNSKHTLLISDACFSGSIFKTRAAFDVAPKDVKILHEMPSRTAITSGTLTEVPDKSVFIEYLIKRLQQNQEKFLTTEGLFNSFRRAVISNSVTDQVPQYGSIHMTGDEGGEFIFIKMN